MISHILFKTCHVYSHIPLPNSSIIVLWTVTNSIIWIDNLRFNWLTQCVQSIGSIQCCLSWKCLWQQYQWFRKLDNDILLESFVNIMRCVSMRRSSFSMKYICVCFLFHFQSVSIQCWAWIKRLINGCSPNDISCCWYTQKSPTQEKLEREGGKETEIKRDLVFLLFHSTTSIDSYLVALIYDLYSVHIFPLLSDFGDAPLRMCCYCSDFVHFCRLE